ncbi:fucolectin-5-like [Cyprinodon tularosa]|uniref:fucolectin-5-like n=1 Tax=Cyprinodon tularosa TaxID=77115 RepID=UPI0018E1E670|nr:fucolectin-5-like [Cyprinodon tularosa]
MLWSLVFIWVITTQNVAVQTTDLCNTKNINLTGKTASQSSDFFANGSPYIANRAFDGDRFICSHTELQTNPWWRIDLQGIYSISCISVYNRNGLNTNISGAQIYIGNSLENNGTNNRLVYNITDFQENQLNIFRFSESVAGRYVTFFTPKRSHMILCEVNITGTEIESPFKLININKTWEDSRSYCRANHRGLATILDEQLQFFAAMEAEKANSPFAWIGLRFVCNKPVWFWADNCTIDYEVCDISGAMETKGQHKWFSKSDTEKFNFICAL